MATDDHLIFCALCLSSFCFVLFKLIPRDLLDQARQRIPKTMQLNACSSRGCNAMCTPNLKTRKIPDVCDFVAVNVRTTKKSATSNSLLEPNPFCPKTCAGKNENNDQNSGHVPPWKTMETKSV